MSITTVDLVKADLTDGVLIACLYESATPDTTDLDARIQAVCDSVDGLVLGYLRGRYSVPMAPWPDPLPYVATQLAVYDICNRRGLSEKDPEDQSVIRGRKEALKILEQIAAGRIVLEDSQTAPETNLKPEFEGPDRVFSRDNMKGF